MLPVYTISQTPRAFLNTFKMESTNTSSSTKTGRPRSATIPRSPRLSRTSSGASSEIRGLTSISPQQSINRTSSVSLPEIRALTLTSPQPAINRASRSATTSPRPSVHRSRSTTKSRTTTKEEENQISFIRASKVSNSPQRNLSLSSNDDHSRNVSNHSNVAKLIRSSSHNLALKRVEKSLIRSPSAWALSPGRASPVPPLAPESPKVKTMTGVLKYFNKQKKTPPAQEEEFHQYKVMYNRLLQWRFANAKAEAANAKVKAKAEEKLFAVWLKLYKTRYAIAEKRIKVERLKQKIKLLEIVCPQLDLLIDWEKLEKKNCEAVGRVTRKLSALSTKVPLVNGATANITSMFEAMKSALEVMENIEESIINFHLQAEKVSNLLRKLIHTLEQNMECFQELEKEITSIMSLEAQEKSLIVHFIQANKEPEEGQMNCKHHLMKFIIKKDSDLPFSILNVS